MKFSFKSFWSGNTLFTEEKAKVFTAAWETEIIKFLAAIAILNQDDVKKYMNRITTTLQNGC